MSGKSQGSLRWMICGNPDLAEKISWHKFYEVFQYLSFWIPFYLNILFERTPPINSGHSALVAEFWVLSCKLVYIVLLLVTNIRSC